MPMSLKVNIAFNHLDIESLRQMERQTDIQDIQTNKYKQVPIHLC